MFNKFVTVKVLYQDTDNDGLVDSTRYAEDTLKLMWWDGYEWRLVGGRPDTDKNIVESRLKHFSVYGLFPVTNLQDSDYRPKERIITPAKVDTKNDYATFGGLDPGDLIAIYDITGRKIRSLYGSETNVWDGLDDDGRMVESGIYIYQIKKGSHIISGTVVVAK